MHHGTPTTEEPAVHESVIVQRLQRLHEEIVSLREAVLSMSTFVTERLTDQDAIGPLTKQAWARSHPTPALTWNTEMTGDAFLSRVRHHAGDDLGRLLEIGPGYGRLMEAIARLGMKFSDYLGVDLSPASVAFLRERFGSDRVKYECADLFTFDAPKPRDTIVSSAVFLHLYPSIEPAMRRCRAMLRDGGRLFFDVLKGGTRYIHPVSRIFVRGYTPTELGEISQACGFRNCMIDHHENFAPGQPGWLVCATA